MALTTIKQPCIKCDKGGGITVCGGCQQWFCTKHFIAHRDELALRMDHVEQEHDILQHDLTEENGIHPLLSRINNWEKISIRKIQETAEKIRNDLQTYLDDHKKQLRISFDKVARELQTSREADDYTEVDLKKWIEQLEEVRRMFETSLTIDIVDDEQREPIIRLIRLKEQSVGVGVGVTI